MANLRNANPSKLWDWEFLNDCFTNVDPSSKIRVSDIDGIVERNGQMLVIENKKPNEKMPYGQKLTLESFAAQGHTVLVVYGNSPEEITSYEIWRLSSRQRHDSATTEEVKRRVESWFAWANSIRIGASA